MPANNSYIYRLLARLAFLSVRAVPPNESQSAIELYNWLRRASEADLTEPFSPPVSIHTTLEVLEKLEALGIVQSVPDADNDAPPEEGGARTFWRFSPWLSPDTELATRDGGNGFDGTPPGVPPGGGEGVNPGGQGLGEVLAHPILFTLPDSEWEALISSALSDQ